MSLNFVDGFATRIGLFVTKHFLGICLLSYAWGWAFYAALLLRNGTNPLLRFEEDGTLTGMIPWKATQYYVNYPEHGFVRRGLIGSLFRFVPQEHAPIAILVLSLCAGLVAILLLSRFFKLALARAPQENTAYLRAIMVVTALSPLGVSQIAYDAGRFDVYGLIAFLLTSMFLLEGRNILATTAVVIALLIHEGFALYGGAALLSTMLIRQNPSAKMSTLRDIGHLLQERSHKSLISLVLVIASLTILLRFYGGSETVANVDFGVGHVVWVGESFGLAREYTTLTYVSVLILTTLLLAAIFGMLRANTSLLIPLAVAYAAPFLLFLAGNNWARFLHLQTMCFVVFTTVLIAFLGAATPQNPRRRNFITLMLVALLPLGPIGITDTFPYVDTLKKTLIP